MTEYYSLCCDALPYNEVYNLDGESHGMCSRCKEHSTFYSNGFDEENDWNDELEYMKEHL